MDADKIRAQAAAAVAASNVVHPAPGTPGAAKEHSNDTVQPAPVLSEVEELKKQNEQLRVQLAQALGIIATTSPQAVAAVEGERTYYSTLPFVKIQVMKGPGICQEFQFKGGKLTTDDSAAIAFLEKAIATGDLMFSRENVPHELTPEEKEMKQDVLASAVTARDKMLAAGEKVA